MLGIKRKAVRCSHDKLTILLSYVLYPILLPIPIPNSFLRPTSYVLCLSAHGFRIFSTIS